MRTQTVNNFVHHLIPSAQKKHSKFTVAYTKHTNFYNTHLPSTNLLLHCISFPVMVSLPTVSLTLDYLLFITPSASASPEFIHFSPFPVLAAPVCTSSSPVRNGCLTSLPASCHSYYLQSIPHLWLDCVNPSNTPLSQGT